MSTEKPPASAAPLEDSPQIDTWISALGRMSAAHPAMARTLRVVEQLQDRPYRSHALLLGEPGTGKEGLARLLHQLMHPEGAPCEKLQIAGLGSNPGASDEVTRLLFGGDGSAGAWDRARGGSLILDEVLALPGEAQRLLQEALSRQRWSNSAAAVVVLAQSDGDLGTAVARGVFRHDLAYKLARIVLNVPPLRERPEDLAQAALWTTNRILKSRGMKRTAELSDASDLERAAISSDEGPTYQVTSEALAVLQRHASGEPRSWPGNFRELEAVLERAILLYSDGDTLRKGDIERALEDSLNLFSIRGER